MRDCYLVHGWNKPAKTPIWLPREVRNPGTLRSILQQWFPSSKDKVTIVFEYINKDKPQPKGEAVIAQRFSDLSIEHSDNTLLETLPSSSDSPISASSSAVAYLLHSSPPLPTLHPTIVGNVLPASNSGYQTSVRVKSVRTKTNISDSEYQNSGAARLLLISSSNSEFPTLQELITTTRSAQFNNTTALASITVRPSSPVNHSSSFLLSTVPDSPEINALPSPLSRPLAPSPAIPIRSLSKVRTLCFALLSSCSICQLYFTISTNITFSGIGFR